MDIQIRKVEIEKEFKALQEKLKGLVEARERILGTKEIDEIKNQMVLKQGAYAELVAQEKAQEKAPEEKIDEKEGK